MELRISQSEAEDIKSFLFKDDRENMALGICRQEAPDVYRLHRLFLPADGDFSKRTAGVITLKAESAYAFLMRLKREYHPAFLQMHSHVSKAMCFFSHVDDENNRFNVVDIRELHPLSEFMRIVFTGDDYAAEYFSFETAKFCSLRVVVD